MYCEIFDINLSFFANTSSKNLSIGRAMQIFFSLSYQKNPTFLNENLTVQPDIWARIN
jgi:hypothetical protein